MAIITDFDADITGATLAMKGIAGGQSDGAGHDSAIGEVTRTLRWDGHRWVDAKNGRPLWCCLWLPGVAAKWGLGAGD